jgi:hypothetical protein
MSEASNEPKIKVMGKEYKRFDFIIGAAAIILGVFYAIALIKELFL